MDRPASSRGVGRTSSCDPLIANASPLIAVPASVRSPRKWSRGPSPGDHSSRCSRLSDHGRANIGHLAEVSGTDCLQARSMNQDTSTKANGISVSGVHGVAPCPTGFAGRFPGTDTSNGLVLALVAIGLPRTILSDLDVVEPESGLPYYALALTPFAVWLGVAVMRRSRKPLVDFVIVGLLYGLSLIVVHQVLWEVGSSPGHHPPA